MKKLIIIICIVLLFSACKKDCSNPCIKNIEEDIELDIYFDKLYCNGGNEYTKYYSSKVEYQDDNECSRLPIPFEIGFEGIIIAQGIRVPYGGQAYSPSVEIQKDSCDRVIDFHFILESIDTSQLFEHNENVIVLLNGVDASYTVNFSHEIIPFGE